MIISKQSYLVIPVFFIIGKSLSHNFNKKTFHFEAFSSHALLISYREMDGSFPVYTNCFFESTKQEDQICSNPGQQFEHLEQQGNGCMGLQQLGEEYSYPTPFGSTLGMEEDQEKKIKSEMELNNLQQHQQQHDPSMYDPTANNNGGCFQIPHDQSMFATDHHHHHHQNWVPDSMFGQTSYNQVCV